MKIAIIIEGQTETGFIKHLQKYLERHLRGNMPKFDLLPYDGRVPKGDRLKSLVRNLLTGFQTPADHVIALTDVYTGALPHDFSSASEAKNQMRQWVGSEPRFHPHAAQHDFEAWLLPYWADIQRLAGHNKSAPPGNPESVNHNKPPSAHIKEIFLTGNKGKRYVKPRDSDRILRNNDLSVAISQCSELKALVNTILRLCGSSPIP